MRYVKDKVATVFNTALLYEGIRGNGAITPRILKPRQQMDVSGQILALVALFQRRQLQKPAR